MNYVQAVEEITELFPDFKTELNETKSPDSYSVIRTFTERIKNLIRQNDSNLLFKSLQKVDKIYLHGDTLLKNAIENTFIYSLDNFTAFCSKEYRQMIFSHISSDLKNSYSRQIYSHGIWSVCYIFWRFHYKVFKLNEIKNNSQSIDYEKQNQKNFRLENLEKHD